ncbi:MAG: hypothetical protein LWX01_04290 [Deltaproteobacteria bacterium]|nr:hypothetical protein [Deltaproteobacteria bacterium]
MENKGGALLNGQKTTLLDSYNVGKTGNAPLTITGKQVIKIDIFSLHNFDRTFLNIFA